MPFTIYFFIISCSSFTNRSLPASNFCILFLIILIAIKIISNILKIPTVLAEGGDILGPVCEVVGHGGGQVYGEGGGEMIGGIRYWKTGDFLVLNKRGNLGVRS